VNEDVEQTDVGKTRDLRGKQVEFKAAAESQQITIGEEGTEAAVADIVYIDGGSAQNVQAQTVEVEEGAILHVEADEVDMQEGVIGMARGEAVTVQEGVVGVAVADQVVVHDGAVLLAAAQEIGGEAQVLLDLKAALVLGVVAGAVCGLIRVLAGRKK
jgi:hypothetical protein